MKIYKQAWPYCFTLAVISFFIFRSIGEVGQDWGWSSFVFGFIITTALVGSGLFSLTMSIINHFKKTRSDAKY